METLSAHTKCLCSQLSTFAVIAQLPKDLVSVRRGGQERESRRPAPRLLFSETAPNQEAGGAKGEGSGRPLKDTRREQQGKGCSPTCRVRMVK